MKKMYEELVSSAKHFYRVIGTATEDELERAFMKMDARYQTVFRMRYDEDAKLKAIGAVLHLSEERVRQLDRLARRQFVHLILQELYKDDIMNAPRAALDMPSATTFACRGCATVRDVYENFEEILRGRYTPLVEVICALERVGVNCDDKVAALPPSAKGSYEKKTQSGKTPFVSNMKGWIP